MFRTAWTIGRLRGIPLRLHVSLLLVVPLFAAGLTRQIEQVAPGPLVLSPTIFGLLMSVAIFVAIALHELGHALVARRQGARVQAITLMILGGLTEIERRPTTPMQDLRVAAAGPLVNLVLGAVALVLARLVSQADLFAGLFVFGQINLALALFNLVPAFPMDGGRILKALLQRWMPETRAVRIAATVGRGFALAAMGFGLVGGHFGLALVGLFVYLGAGAEAEATVARAAVEGATARQAMATRVVTVQPTAHVPGVARHMLMNGAEAALVRDLERTYGVLLVEDLLRAADVPARQLLADRAPLWVEAEDPLEAVVRAMAQARQPAIVRDTGNTVIGVVTWEALERLSRLRGLVDADRAGGAPLPDNATPR